MSIPLPTPSAGCRALVTGANRGIGRAVCAELHQRGHQVVVSARSLQQAQRAAAEIGEAVCAVELDVTNSDSVHRAAAEVGSIDVLVANAGVLFDHGAPPSSVSLDVVRRTWEVNVIGAWRVCQAFAPAMAARGWGRVVLISSGAGCFRNGLAPAIPAYSISKASLNALTVLLAAELRGSGVLVNAVNPGMVRTEMMPAGRRTPQEAAVDIADVADLPDDGPTGCLLRAGQRLEW